MKLARPVVTAAVLACLASGVSAQAAAKPVCDLGTDPAGDANSTPLVGVVGAGPSDDAYDITSFDVANNAKSFTSVIRVKKLAKTSNTSPMGLHWTLQFDVLGDTYQLSAHNSSSGLVAELDSVDTSQNMYSKIDDATLVMDTAKNEVRVTVSPKEFGKLVAGRTKVTGLQAVAGRYYDVPGVVSATDATDTATSSKTYTAFAPSCVKPGK